MPLNDSRKSNNSNYQTLKKGWSVMLLPLFLLAMGCTNKSEKSPGLPSNSELEHRLDDWHKAAAMADSASYFDFIHSEGRFLGTDATENWSKQQFLEFSTPYFQKGKAWSFTGFDRNWYYSADSTVAWFDERLNTWMGECRGSGVIIWGGEDVKLSHYNLAVTIANEKIQDFIKINSEE